MWVSTWTDVKTMEFDRRWRSEIGTTISTYTKLEASVSLFDRGEIVLQFRESERRRVPMRVVVVHVRCYRSGASARRGLGAARPWWESRGLWSSFESRDDARRITEDVHVEPPEPDQIAAHVTVDGSLADFVRPLCEPGSPVRPR
jgi:hypothetical protein